MFYNLLESQSSPSYKPSPLVAQVAWINHFLFLRLFNPSVSVISDAFMALGKSYNTRQRQI